MDVPMDVQVVEPAACKPKRSKLWISLNIIYLYAAVFVLMARLKAFAIKKGALGLIPYIEEGLRDRDVDGAMVSMTGCLKVCDRGPAIVIYPNNWWYGRIENEAAIDDILDALEKGEAAQKYLIA